ncbi:hypothetical protein H0H92_015540 [Tricholoma furcatifolium]|nr:hypothetical protein H0H92_015540 [Tricholoma furcatifolium]
MYILPLHAAASYGQLDILAFLISRGGNVNITDADGDTPLYTVENIETARFLVEHGAIIDRRNAEGISVRFPQSQPKKLFLTPQKPIEHLLEDFPHVSAYLQSLGPSSESNSASASAPEPPSQHAQNAEAEQLTSALMASVAEIMQRAEAEGRDPEEELRAVVSRTVAEGVLAGYQLTSSSSYDNDAHTQSDSPSKRPKTDSQE